MAVWRFSIGNAVKLAARAPVASLSSSADSILPLSALGNGFPDEPGRWARNAAALYGADADLNRIAETSERSDAPTGWFDFANLVTGTPGLPANPPDFGNYGGRNPALRFFRPIAQDVDVMPGEEVVVRAGIYLPSTSSATAVRLRVIDLWTGRSYDGTANAWDDADVEIAEQTVVDTWLDFAEVIPADPNRRERTRYRVLLEQSAPSFDANSFCYASDQSAPGSVALYPTIDFAAIVGHNIPRDALVSVRDFAGGGSAITLTPEVPSFFGTGAAQQFRTWRLRVEMPAGTAAFHERPYIGELWLGTLEDLVWCPAFPFDLTVIDPGQIRVEGGYGREYVYSDAPRALGEARLLFKVNGDAGYQQIRDALEGATRNGVDPLMLVPVDLIEGAGTIYHGRLGNQVTYSRKNNARREFTLPFQQSPFPRVAG